MVQMDLVTFDGSVEQCEAIRQFGRDFVWDLARGERLEDPAFAVDQAVADIVAAIDGEPNPEAVERLRGELLKSAERANAEQHVMSIEKATELGTRAGRDAVDEFAAELRTDTAEDRQIIKQLATALRLEQVSESGLTQLFSMSEDELDAECRRLGIDPDGLAKRGLEAVRKAKLDFYHPGGVRPVNCHCEFCFTKEDAAEWDAEWMSAT